VFGGEHPIENARLEKLYCQTWVYRTGGKIVGFLMIADTKKAKGSNIHMTLLLL